MALPLDQYEGSVQIITREEELDGVFKHINAHDCVGFDTETKPVFVKGQFNHVSLIQIAIPGKVFLIRTNHVGLPDQMCAFFENENIKKLGVALTDDIKELRKLRDFAPRGFCELNEMVNKLGIESNGLRNLTATILGFRISKNAQVTNWEATVLSEKQVRYAATDAWVCLEMYDKLRNLGLL
jgi:ribonuclease D